jgi:hypothetical protein
MKFTRTDLSTGKVIAESNSTSKYSFAAGAVSPRVALSYASEKASHDAGVPPGTYS